MVANDKQFKKDIIYFNLLMAVFLAVMTMVLLYAPSSGSLNMFIPAACMIINLIITYNLGLQRGLVSALILTFAYGSYIIHETMIVRRVDEINLAYIAWLFLYPLSSWLSGQLALAVTGYRRDLETKKGLEQLITIDAATGLYNDREFFKRLEEEFLRAKRYKICFSILIIKISNFDELKAIYGQLNSTKILQAVSDKVTAHTRHSDVKSLIDSNILSIILTATNEDGAKEVREKLHQTLDSIAVEIKGIRKVIRVKPNIGISSVRDSDTDFLELYDRAKEELNYDRG